METLTRASRHTATHDVLVPLDGPPTHSLGQHGIFKGLLPLSNSHRNQAKVVVARCRGVVSWGIRDHP